MAWPTDPRPAKSLLVLRDMIDARWPNRAKGNDGMLGDARHAATKSDHNPNKNGVVTAIDITHDPAHGLDSRAVAQSILDSRDPRIKYIISKGEICSSLVSPWVWRPYSGSDDHSHHFHLSVIDNIGLFDSELAWKFWPVLGAAPIQVPESPHLTNSGKGSWYSQYNGKFKWVDTGDAPNSSAIGVPDDAQGVSFYNKDTLGKWFEVRAPNGVTSIEQQTDIGPHPNTKRLIDISAAAAERFGYSPSNFPTDQVFSWSQIDAPLAVSGLPPKEQAVRLRDLRSAAVPPPPPTSPPPTKEADMNILAFAKYLPFLMRFLQIIPLIQDALKSGQSIFAVIQKFAPDMLGVLASVSSDLFPTLTQESQAKVGGLILDPVKVRLIQGQINKLGIAKPVLEEDGHYGPKTKDAVTAFQTAHSITPADGWAGDITSAALQTEVNKLKPADPIPVLSGGEALAFLS